MALPKTYTAKNETGCCPIVNTKGWDKKEVSLAERPFIRKRGRSFLYMPLNVSSVLKSLHTTAEGAGALPPEDQAMFLTRDLSPWKADQFYAVSKPIDGADNVVLEGTYLSRVYEGPYRDAKKWWKDLKDSAPKKLAKDPEIYFFYTTCPKCAKHYGKNYVIGFVRIK